MPASVSYRINGKYDASAMNKANGGIATLEQSAKKLTSSLKGMVIGAVSIGAITKALKDCSSTFLTNDKVQNQAMKSLQNNTKMTATAIKSLVKEIDGMAGYFEGSELVNATNIISKYVGTPEDIKKTLQAARDMAADGIMPLDQAAKALGQSFNGNVKSLQKMYPELKNLTEEELKNGKAVEYLSDKYKGVEDAMTGTFSGRDSQFKNTIDSVKDAIGEIIQSVKFVTQGKLIENLNKIITWIKDSQLSIINFFINLPEIASVALKAIKDVILRLFDPGTFISVIGEIGAAMFDTFSIVIESIAKIAQSVINNISLDVGSSIYSNIMQGLLKITKSPIFDMVARVLLPSGTYAAIKAIDLTTEVIDKASGDKIAAEIDSFKKDVKKSLTESTANFEESWKNAFQNITSLFSDITGQAESDIAALLKKELPKDLVAAIEASYLDNDNGNDNGNGASGEKDMTVFNGITGLLGDLGNAIQSIVSSAGLFGVLIQLISALISDIQTKSVAASKFLSAFSVLADKINDENVVKFTDGVLIPLMKAVENIGVIISSVVGPILNIIAPYLEGFAKAIEAVVNVIATVATGLYNLYVDIHNAIPFSSKMERKSYSDIWDESSYTASASSSAGSVASGTAASYTAARDVYVTINFDHSFVNGDSREIAISLYNEIKSAERLGLIG